MGLKSNLSLRQGYLCTIYALLLAVVGLAYFHPQICTNWRDLGKLVSRRFYLVSPVKELMKVDTEN